MDNLPKVIGQLARTYNFRKDVPLLGKMYNLFNLFILVSGITVLTATRPPYDSPDCTCSNSRLFCATTVCHRRMYKLPNEIRPLALHCTHLHNSFSLPNDNKRLFILQPLKPPTNSLQEHPFSFYFMSCPWLFQVQYIMAFFSTLYWASAYITRHRASTKTALACQKVYSALQFFLSMSSVFAPIKAVRHVSKHPDLFRTLMPLEPFPRGYAEFSQR